MLVFLPQPKVVNMGAGSFRFPNKLTIGIGERELFPVAARAREVLKNAEIAVAVNGVVDTLTISRNDALRSDGYTLAITADGIRIEARSEMAAFYGVQTLAQVLQQSSRGVAPMLTIEDWPDFADRGLYYDVCRGRVPTLDWLKELANQLAHYKMNHLQLYVEHTFRFRRHPDIGKDASPLTANDIMELDAYCRERYIELVPSLACFGHLATVLNHPIYRQYAEDLGEGKYVDPEAKGDWWGKGWSLAPANEESYVFLDQLFSEFLPCFSSDRFNVCCDETYDLGWGQSYKLAQRIGKGRLYLNHILRLRELSGRYGKRIMFWGDIIRHHPELIPGIPSDVTVLDWGYNAKMDFNRVKDFTETGLATYVCPSVCGYVTLFPRIFEAAQNIAGWAVAGKEHGAQGMLNTDWGDGGHYNFMECAWPGYLVGAEQSWHAGADLKTFWERFSLLFLNIDMPQFQLALMDLGDIAQLSCNGFYQSFWRHVFFAVPGDPILQNEEREFSYSEGGVIKTMKMRADARLGKQTADKLARIRNVIKNFTESPNCDPHQILPYWLFAVDTLLHAATKLAVLGKGGEDTPATRKMLKDAMTALSTRFEQLWMARNRRSEIQMTLDAYQKAIEGLGAEKAKV